MRRQLLALAAVSILAVLLSAAPAGAADYPAGFDEQTIVGGLDEPMSMAWAPDGRLFIIEKPGRLKVAAPGATTATTILDIAGRVNQFSDRGLLDLALDSNFASNGFIYLAPHVRGPAVDSGHDGSDGLKARALHGQGNALVAPQVVLGSYDAGPCPPASNTLDCLPSDGLSHQSAPSSRLRTGRSGSGTATRPTTTPPTRSLFAPTTRPAWPARSSTLTPTGNGLPGHSFCPGDGNLTHVCTKVHSKGFRNPFRFKLRPNGSLVVADVGWGTREEVNLIGAGGKSYGWPCYEGTMHTSGYDGQPECAPEYAKENTANAHVAPQHDYQHGDRGNAVMAGPEYLGLDYPAGYRGDIFFADFSEGFIKRLKLGASGQVTSVEPFATDWGGVDLKEAPNGDLAFSNGYDAIKRIVHATVAGTPRAVLSATPADGRAPLEVQFDSAGSRIQRAPSCHTTGTSATGPRTARPQGRCIPTPRTAPIRRGSR